MHNASPIQHVVERKDNELEDVNLDHSPHDYFYAMPYEQVAQKFDTDLQRGLAAQLVATRQMQYGPNTLPKPPKPSKLIVFLSQFKDFLILLLLAVGIVELGFQEWIEGGVLLLVVFGNTLVGYNQEIKAQAALDALESMTQATATAIRDGVEAEVLSAGLVPGDVIVLEEGDLVPADVRFFEASNLQIEEKNLTGEADAIMKVTHTLARPTDGTQPKPGDQVNMGFMTTTVLKGRGKAIVVRTGKGTEVGSISADLSEDAQKTPPLTRKLKSLGYRLVAISIILCVLVVGIGLLRRYTDRNELTGKDVELWIKIGVSLAVAVVPEGLVAVVTVTMALGVQRMAARHAIVRRLPAVETLGSVTYICSDKTGTLTEGKMRLEYLWTPSRLPSEVHHLDNDELMRIESEQYLRAQSDGMLLRRQAKLDGSLPLSPSMSFVGGVPSNKATKKKHVHLRQRVDKEEEDIRLERAISHDPRALGRILAQRNAARGETPAGTFMFPFVEEAAGGSRTPSKSKSSGSRGRAKAIRTSIEKAALGRKRYASIGEASGEHENAVVLEVDAQKADKKSKPQMADCFEFEGKGIVPEGKISMGNEIFVDGQKFVRAVPLSMLRSLIVCSLCNNSSLRFENDAWEATGDTTEVALAVASHKANMSKPTLLGANLVEFVCELPFDSERKRHTVVYKHKNDPTNVVAMCKGAFDLLVVRCSQVHAKDDNIALGSAADGLNVMKRDQTNVIPMTDAAREAINAQAAVMSSQGLRVLGLAYKEMSAEDIQEMPEEIEQNLVFVGLVGIRDPPRPECKAAVKEARGAGITVCMITGDHSTTAVAIAKQLGIMMDSDEERVISGQQLDLLSQKDLQDRKPFPLVFARVSPANKLAIVKALKAKGEIVAMTGDGVNDAPAIKHAHCGVAMGLGGTDLTKQSADIVLLDDNFATIIAAVEEGRLTYDNIKKFVLYLLACNSSEIYVTLAAVCIGYPSPFSPIMILWANLIIDLPPALALGVDPPLGDVMLRLPRNPQAHLLNLQVACVLLVQGFVIALLSLGVYALGMEVLGYPEVGGSLDEHRKEAGRARTLAFLSLGSMHLMQGYISRSIYLSTLRRAIFDNKALNYGVLLSTVLLTVALYIPGLKYELEMYSLKGQDWGLVFACLVVQLFASEFIKKYLVRGFFARRSERALAERKAKGLALFHND